MASDKQKVLIVGGGFGGVKVALDLADHPHFGVTLLSDQENFRYYPVGSSRVDLQACKLEYSIVSPK